jgi:hypothetical protein
VNAPTPARAVTSVQPGEDEVLAAFRLIDDRLARHPGSAALTALRERLAGELVGDGDRVDATLSPGFSLVTHAGGATRTTGREEVIASVRRLGATPGGALMWLSLDGLVVDGDAVAAHGTLLTMSPAPDGGLRRTAAPLAFFIRFDGPAMASESLFLDVQASRSTVVTGSLLDPGRCLELVGGPPAAS